MDNITHTLIGALVGEAAASRRTARVSADDVRGRNFLVWISAIGSNLPDCDVLYTALAHEKLNYILEHRGYTHTILGAIVAGLLIFAGAMLFARQHRWTLSRNDRWRIGAMSFFTPLLHIGMDFTNNYGVHPFWPWNNAWFYGDSIFIIEPFLWAACAPLAFTLRSVAGRILVGIVLVASIVLPVVTGLVPIPAVFAIATASGLLLWLARTKHTAAVLSGLACWLLVTGCFAAGHAQAVNSAAQISHDQFPEQHLLDAVLTPLPANPFCWETLFVQADDRNLTVRRAMMSVMPSVIDAARCPARSLDRRITAPIAAVDAENSVQLKWYGETQTALSRLRALDQSDCDVAGLLRFARAPWSAVVDDRRVVGDLRFDREPSLGFAEIEALGHTSCRTSAPWLPPRADILGSEKP